MMATLERPERIPRRASEEFVDSAVLEAFVPSISNVNLQELFESWDGESVEAGSSIVPFIEQRQFLLLDELVAAYVVLRIPAIGEDELRSYLSRLAITLEARAVGQQLQKTTDGPQTQLNQVTELLSSEVVKNSDDPLILATEIQVEPDANPLQYIYVFWKVILPLGRPRAKLQKLGIFFAPTATLRPVETKAEIKSGEDDYLPSQQPASVNLLQPFANDSALRNIAPHLSALRITKQAATVPVIKQLARPIRNGPRRLFRAAPAVLWRLRFSAFPALMEKDSIFACFDIEITQFAGSDVVIDKVTSHLSSGTAELVGVQLPQRCRPGEQLTVIYKLLAGETSEKSDTDSQSRELTIAISATVLVSSECAPKVKIKWKTALEVPRSRPNSRSALSPQDIKPSGITNSLYGELPTTPGPDTLIMTGGSFAEMDTISTFSSGVNVTVSGKKEVYVGEVFRWEVFVVNRSEKVYRFTVHAIPKRRMGDANPSTRRLSFSGMGNLGSNTKEGLPRPVLDDNVVYSIQKSEMTDATELICLQPEVRIATLGPSACYTAVIKFLPLASGVLRLEALRLIDTSTQHAIEIRHLPDIVSVEKRSS